MVTRFAPSPTGEIHIGSIRTAYINWLAAKCNNGKFILRIDDTDIVRSNLSNIALIYNTLASFNLDYDTTFKQSSRINRYYELAKNIGTVREDTSIFISWNDVEITLIKQNYTPTYNFASVVDDLDYGVTNIIRGTDHISNLPLQQYIWSLLTDKPFPIVQHIGLLLDKDGKLSKRKGNGLVSDYINNNISPEILLAWLIKHGWSHKDPNFEKKHKIFTREVMLSEFNNGNLRQTNTTLDINKLKYIISKWK